MPKLNDALGMKVGSQPVKRVYQGSTVVLYGIENLATNPSFEGTGAQIEVRRNLVTRPTAVNGGWSSNNPATHVISLDATVQRRAGVSSRKCYYNGTAGINVAVLSLYSVGSLTNATVDRLPVTAGTAYTMSVYVRASYANTRYQMSASFYNAGGASLGSISTGILTTTIAANTWGQLVQSNIVAPANSATCFLNLALYTPSAQANGAQLTDFGWATDVCFEAGSAKTGDYFDGTTGGDTDLTPSWTGTANASASVLKGLGVTGVTPGSPTIPYSTTYAPKLGSRAHRELVKVVNHAAMGINVTNTLPLTGTLYTLLMSVRPMTRDLTAAPRIRATTGSIITFPVGVWTDVRYTAIAGAGTNMQTGIVDFSGVGYEYGDIIDFDGVALVEGTYAGPYRDGSNAGWVWSGTANNSSSYGLG